MIMRTNESTSDVLVTIISPLGTLITKGLEISLDGKKLNEKPYGFNYCTQNGCFTSIVINKEKIEVFKKSKELNFKYVLQNQQALNIDLNLKNFSGAFEKITKF